MAFQSRFSNRKRTLGWLHELNYTHTFIVVSLHVCGLLALWYWPRRVDALLCIGVYLTATLGVGVGYHRLLTHRGFKSPRWLRRLLTWMGAAALQGGPSRWSAIHRRHHRLADREGDPHSPTTGFFHAHLGWVLKRDEVPDVDYRKLVPDVSGNDPWMRILDYRFLFVLPWMLAALFCYGIAGWRGVLWGSVVSTLALWHFTWSINSIGHLTGRRPNATHDGSGNVWWLGLLTLGEGWHNNHHARSASALHGWHWYQIDVSGYVIRGLARCGIIKDVITPRLKS